MGKGVKQKSVFDMLRGIPTAYSKEVQRLAKYLEENSLGLEGAGAFLKSLESETRIDREGREVIYSASWYNQHVKAVKESVRYALDHAPGLSNGQKWAVEKHLKSLKLKKMPPGISKADRVPDAAEVKILIDKADRRLALMIEFLAQTGCRISEMIGAEVGRSRRQPKVTRITILGKGGKQRDLRCRTDLFDRIRSEFQGQRWLFEHSGRQYNPKSVTIRIKQLGERTIGKAVTAHMLRHYRGTVLSEKLGISKASSELGHSDIRTTKKFYDHSEVSDEEFLSTLEVKN